MSTPPNVRAEKQKIIDARRDVRTTVNSRRLDRDDEQLPEEIKVEFNVLDDLSRSLLLCCTSIGSVAEALAGQQKSDLAARILNISGRFADILTRNRMRIDYESMRTEFLDDEKIWLFK